MKEPPRSGDGTRRRAAVQPFPEKVTTDPVGHLYGQANRLGLVVEGSTVRRDTRAARAKLLLLLLRARCPLEAVPARPWYVKGAAVRLGAEGIRRMWTELWTEEPPVLRSVRSHLKVLEQGLALVRQPGDWQPVLDPDPGVKRPRFPDTLHVLERDEDAEWWAVHGQALLLLHPEVRQNPSAWKTHVGNWRQTRKPVQLELFTDVLAKAWTMTGRSGPNVVQGPDGLAAGELFRVDDSDVARGKIVHLVREQPRDAAQLLRELAEAGVPLEGANRFRLLGDAPRLRGALAMLAVALNRKKLVRNRAGWLVQAWQNSTLEERTRALLQVVA